MQQRKTTMYRVKGIVRSSQMQGIWDSLADVDFEHTPTLRFTRTLQDKKCDKELSSGKRRRKRKYYGQRAFLELKSPIRSDMELAYDVLVGYFLPGTCSSNL